MGNVVFRAVSSSPVRKRLTVWNSAEVDLQQTAGCEQSLIYCGTKQMRPRLRSRCWTAAGGRMTSPAQPDQTLCKTQTDSFYLMLVWPQVHQPLRVKHPQTETVKRTRSVELDLTSSWWRDEKILQHQSRSAADRWLITYWINYSDSSTLVNVNRWTTVMWLCSVWSIWIIWFWAVRHWARL